MIRLRVDPVAPGADEIAQAAEAIRRGGVVAVPTDTLYGLAADPFNEAAVGLIFATKERPEGRALPLIALDLAQVVSCLGPLSPAAMRLAGRFWPGPLTLIVPAPGTLPGVVTGGTGGVAVRVPAHAVAQALCAAYGGPLTATSANLSGQPATGSPDQVARTMGGKVQILLDAGPTAGGPPSTLIDVVGTAPRLVRPGAVSWKEVEEWLRAG